MGAISPLRSCILGVETLVQISFAKGEILKDIRGPAEKPNPGGSQ